jgi:hypothetical protein
MIWLAVTSEQKLALVPLNAAAGSVKVNVVRGTQGGWLVSADALAEAIPSGPLSLFADWYAGLSSTTDIPAKPMRSKKQTELE